MIDFINGMSYKELHNIINKRLVKYEHIKFKDYNKIVFPNDIYKETNFEWLLPKNFREKNEREKDHVLTPSKLNAFYNGLLKNKLNGKKFINCIIKDSKYNIFLDKDTGVKFHWNVDEEYDDKNIYVNMFLIYKYI